MEGQVWSMVCGLLPESNKSKGRFRYRAEDILRVVLWAVLHDRPIAWACQEEHWPPVCRPALLPHPSTVSRRWRSEPVQQAAQKLFQRTLGWLGRGDRYAALDGRPLVVGGSSKDRQARPGRAVGGMGRGYKLHALVDGRHVIVAYEVEPLNVAEPTVALRLLRQAPSQVTRVVADTAYDSMNLHRVAGETGRRLYTPLRQNRVGRRRQPRRLQLLRLNRRAVGRRLLAWRDEVERTFGQTSTIGFGFKGLPSWARRLHRVRRWIWGKNVLHHAWLLFKHHAA
jgi:hypothetical protein